MCFVMQNALTDHDVAGVAFVIAAGVEIAIVFWKRGRGDGDAETISRGDHARGEPQIDVVLVSLAWLEERRTIEAVAEARSHHTILNALSPPIRVDVL